MASKSLSSKDNQRARPAPVTAHPAFPAIVALWFAALMGIGSLVVPPEKLSAVVSALGIPKVIPAAAPPLGFTALALLALLMAGVGVVIGLVIGSRVARRSQVQPARRTDPTRGRQEKPKRAYAYDPAEHHPEPEVEPEPVRQRGPLRASEVFADIEPLTDTTAAATVGEAEAPAEDHFAHLGAPQDWPGDKPEAPALDLQDEEEPIEAHGEAVSEFAAPGPFSTLDEAASAAAGQDRAPAQHVLSAASADAAGEAPEVLSFTDHTARAALVGASLDSLGTVQLVERLALAMAGRLAKGPEAAAPEPVPELAPALVAQPDFAAQEPEPEQVHAEASHQQRELHPLEPQHESESEDARMPHFAAGGAIQAPPQMEPAFASESRTHVARPAILEPVAHVWDDEADEDEVAQVAPPRFLSARQAPEPAERPSDEAKPFGKPSEASTIEMFDDVEDDDRADESVGPDGEQTGEDRYPSLLDIQPFQRTPIAFPAPEAAPAHDPEPVVVFPGSGPRADAPFAPPPASTLQSRRTLPFHAPSAAMAGVPVTPPELPTDPVDADEADRALRAALATLQRMSGGR